MKRNDRIVSTSLLAMVLVMVLSMVMPMITTVVAVPVNPGEDAIAYFEPQHSTATYGNSQTMDVYINSTVPIRSGALTIYTTNNGCGNITGATYNSTNWFRGAANVFDGGNATVLGFAAPADKPAGVYHIGTFTVTCENAGSCSCDLKFANNSLLSGSYAVNSSATIIDREVSADGFRDGTFTCMAPQETFSKELVEGWNLISLPLTNTTNMTVANIMSSMSSKYDALYRYDASIHSWVALSSSDTMENGVGYFIHMTSAGTWTYSGSAYTVTDIALEPGLNMVGWVNTSADLPDALNSIAGNYRYVAKWNATAQSYEVYVAGAPPAFNDFTMMERGEGYFIVATTNCTLTYP